MLGFYDLENIEKGLRHIRVIVIGGMNNLYSQPGFVFIHFLDNGIIFKKFGKTPAMMRSFMFISDRIHRIISTLLFDFLPI